MVRPLKAAFYGLAGTALAGIGAAIAVNVAYSPTDLDYFRQQRRSAVVREYGGRELDEILRSQLPGFKLVDTAGGLVARIKEISVTEALESACGTKRFAPAPVCIEYGKVPAAVEAQAARNKDYWWTWPTTWALVATLVAAALSAAAIGYRLEVEHREALRRQKGQL